jgi:hypothetical protein
MLCVQIHTPATSPNQEPTYLMNRSGSLWHHLRFLFCYATAETFHFLHKIHLGVEAVYSNNKSTLLGMKPHSLCQVLQSQECLMTACFVAQFSCCVSRWNITTQYCWLINSTLVILAKTETLCGQSQDILLLKGTKHQLSIYDKKLVVHRFLHACLTFQFRLCTVTERRLKKCDKKSAYHFHTNKYRSLLVALWCQAFPNTYAETEMPHWWSPLWVIIKTEVWFVEI